MMLKNYLREVVKSSLEVSAVNSKVSNLWPINPLFFAAFNKLGHACPSPQQQVNYNTKFVI